MSVSFIVVSCLVMFSDHTHSSLLLSSIYMSSSWTVIGKNGAAAAKVRLQRGARVKAEPDALITMSQHVEIGADMDAGLVSGFMRSALGGESLFSQTLTALADGQEVVLGAPDVGDIEIIRVSRDSPLLLTKGAFLAADTSVQLTTATQTSAGGALFSGAGLFVLRACGQGSLAVGAHGSILNFELHAGEERAVDNGHLVGWSEHMPYEMRLASSGGGRRRGLFTSMYASTASGEGLLCYFRGPGSLWLQTHKPPIESDGNGANDSSGRSASSSRNSRGGGLAGLLVGSCSCCILTLCIAAALVGAFVLVPAYGGRWEMQPDGGWTVRWDQDGRSSRARVHGGGSASSRARTTATTTSTSPSSPSRTSSRSRGGAGSAGRYDTYEPPLYRGGAGGRHFEDEL